MKQPNAVVCLLLLFISGYATQDTAMPASTTLTTPPEWNGDPLLCTIKKPVPPKQNAEPQLKFSTQAEFALEIVQDIIVGNTTIGTELRMTEFIYDYDTNHLIQVRNEGGLISVDYFYYNRLIKATYVRGDLCIVNNITQDNPIDGTSAVNVPDHRGPHIRPLEQFLLFSNTDLPDTEHTSVYIGKGVVRGIPVDKWESCYINRATYKTTRRIWSFAQKGVVTSSGPVGDLAVPVEAIISASVDLPDGTRVGELDQIFNVLSFKNGIVETREELSPPKGVFCNYGDRRNLISLNDSRIFWPEHFSVRIDASNSRSGRWERFHLRASLHDDGSPRYTRFDYMPPNGEDYETVIHDFTHNLTFVLDRRIGTCDIRNGVRHPEVSAISDPITFFMKHQRRLIFHQNESIWERNGLRFCRGDTIRCTILTASMINFPAMVDADTGELSGETWAATHLEYGWSVRAPYASPEPGLPKGFDYPVSLFLRMFRYQDPANPSIIGLRSEDVEYEFYEMSHDTNPNDFDTTTCYRSLNYDYLHLVFVLQMNAGNVIDDRHIHRRSLQRRLQYVLAERTMTGYSHISEIEIDHEQVSNDITVFFTLLGKTPYPGSQTGFNESEITADAGRVNLQTAINSGQFEINVRLTDDTEVKFTARSESLKSSKQYISTHAVGKKVVNESYTSGSQATAILVGALVGLFVGVIIAAVIRVIRKDPMPVLPTSISSPLPTINFRSKQAADSSSNKPTSDA